MPGQKSAKTSIIFLTFSLGLVIARPGLMSQGMQDVVNELREILVGSGTCLDVLNRKEFICSQQKLSQILEVEEQLNCS